MYANDQELMWGTRFIFTCRMIRRCSFLISTLFAKRGFLLRAAHRKRFLLPSLPFCCKVCKRVESKVQGSAWCRREARPLGNGPCASYLIPKDPSKSGCSLLGLPHCFAMACDTRVFIESMWYGYTEHHLTEVRVCSGGQTGDRLQSSYCTRCARPGVFAYVKFDDPLESRAICLQLAWPFTSSVYRPGDAIAQPVHPS